MLGRTELKIPAVAAVLVCMALALAWAVAQQGERRVAYFPEALNRASLPCELR